MKVTHELALCYLVRYFTLKHRIYNYNTKIMLFVKLKIEYTKTRHMVLAIKLG